MSHLTSGLGAVSPVGSAQRSPLTTGIETPMMRYQRLQREAAFVPTRRTPTIGAYEQQRYQEQQMRKPAPARRVSVTDQATTRARVRPIGTVAPVLRAAPGVAAAQAAFMPDGPPAAYPMSVERPETVAPEVAPVVVREAEVWSPRALPWWALLLAGAGALWAYNKLTAGKKH